MSILVIGGMGFIGSRITNFLVQLGEEVIVAGRRPLLYRLSDIADKVKVLQGDKVYIEQVMDWVKAYKVEKIIDVSAELESESEQAPYIATRINIVGSLNVFEAARIMGVRRIVWASSLAVYGDKRRAQGIPQNEDSLNNPITVYGACKSYGELVAKVYNAKWNMDIACLRPSSIYGPLRAGGATGWLSDIVRKPLEGEIVDIPQGPEETTNYCFVDDCADAFVRCCQYRGGRLPHAIYYIGGFKATVRQLMDEVKKQIPSAEARYHGKQMYYVDVIDNRLIREDLGFKLNYDLEGGVREQVARQRLLNEKEKSAKVK